MLLSRETAGAHIRHVLGLESKGRRRLKLALIISLNGHGVHPLRHDQRQRERAPSPPAGVKQPVRM